MEKEITIDIRRISKAILLKWWLIAIVAMIGFGAMYVITSNRQVQYTATTSVYNVSYGSFAQTMETNKILAVYGEIATSKSVAAKAVNLLGNEEITVDDILQMIEVVYSEDSAIIRINATSADPQLAVSVVNSMAEAFRMEAKNTFAIDTLKILDHAEQAEISKTKGQLKWSAVGFLAGAFVVMLIIVIQVIQSDDVYYVSDAELEGRLQILGIIPEDK